MTNQSNFKTIREFRLTYSYAYLLFSILGIIFIIFIGNRINFIFFLIFSFVMIGIPVINLKSFAKIILNESTLKLIYRPFYKPQIFEYNINEIETLLIYYSYKRYHSTILFIKLNERSEIIKHTTAMSVSNSKKIVKVFRNLNVNVIEMELPNVEGKVVTLP